MLRCAVAACVLLIGYQLVVTLLRPPWITGATDWLSMSLAWLALVVVGYVARWSTRAQRLESSAWRLMTVALLCYAIARTVWAVEDVVIFPHGVPSPNLPEIFYAFQYPFFFLAIICIPRGRSSTPRVILILDFPLWMGGAVALSWFFMLAAIVTASDLSPLGKMVALFPPVGDLLVLLGLTVTLLRPSISHPFAPVFGLLIAAFACLIVGDTWSTLIVLQHPHMYQPGAAPDVFWLTCYLLIPLAALLFLHMIQRAPTVKRDVTGHALDQEHVLWQDIEASLPHFLPIVGALVATAVITLRTIVRAAETGWRGLFWPIVAIFSLVFLVIMRQAVTCLDDARLRRELAVAQAKAESLLELNRRKDEFLAVVSHEIRTPLTSLAGYLELLAHRFAAWRPQEDAIAGATSLTRMVASARTMLGDCLRSLGRLTRLADDLTDDTRIRDGRLILCLAPCDLYAVVRAAVEEQRALEPDRTIDLDLPAAGPILVMADAERIAQVVTNYLTNALKYSRTERPVTVRAEVAEAGEDACGARAAAGMARVLVRDGGPGLSPADQVCVWERFPHIEAVTVQSGSGVSLGLGLSISKAIVEQHGGEVGVESAVGQGSIFWFTLPLTLSAGVPPAPPAS